MLTAAVIGNLGADAELKYSQNGAALLRCNVAVNLRAKNADGEWEEKTEWVRVTLFGPRAESISPYLLKGQKVYATGRLEPRPWTGNDGALHAGLEIVASEIELCGARPAEHEDRQLMRPTRTVNRQPTPAGVSDDDEPF